MTLAGGSVPALKYEGEAVIESSFEPVWNLIYQDLKWMACQVLEEGYYGEWPESRKREVRGRWADIEGN